MSIGKRLTNGAAVATLIGATLTGGVAVAAAAVSHVDGGTWEHGVSDGQVYSNYWHPGANHSSSVEGQHYANSGCVQPGGTSRASAPARFRVVDKAYYNFC